MTVPAASPAPAEPPSGERDAALVAAARSGDRGAFASLYERYARVVHAVLLSAGVKAEAEDLTQEVFVSAMRSLSSLKDPAAFGGWLVTSARNRAASFLRHKAAAPPLRLVGEAAPTTTTREGLNAEDVMSAIRSLPEAYRDTLVLRLVEGLTGPEIADRTGLTHGSVRVNLHRGMDMLRAKLAEVNP